MDWSLRRDFSMANQSVNFMANQPVNLGRDMVVFNGYAGCDSSVVQPVVIIDSDDEEPGNQRPFQPYQEIVLNKPSGQFLMKHFLGEGGRDDRYTHQLNCLNISKGVQMFLPRIQWMAVSVIAPYQEVPLRYPFRLGGSRSYICDNAPSVKLTSSI